MNSTLQKHLSLLASIGLIFGVLTEDSFARDEFPPESDFRLSSTTFDNDTFMPIITIHNIVVNNANVCSIDGSPGGNQSPELS
jgi:hypothetical protein